MLSDSNRLDQIVLHECIRKNFGKKRSTCVYVYVHMFMEDNVSFSGSFDGYEMLSGYVL